MVYTFISLPKEKGLHVQRNWGYMVYTFISLPKEMGMQKSPEKSHFPISFSCGHSSTKHLLHLLQHQLANLAGSLLLRRGLVGVGGAI